MLHGCHLGTFDWTDGEKNYDDDDDNVDELWDFKISIVCPLFCNIP